MRFAISPGAPSSGTLHDSITCVSAVRSMKGQIAGRDAVRLKKYFYSLRPALALRWLRTRPGWPPMDLPSLRVGVELDRGICDAIDELTVLKARQGEIGTGDRIGILDRFMEAEFAAAEAAAGKGQGIPEALRNSANELFRSIVNGELTK